MFIFFFTFILLYLPVVFHVSLCFCGLYCVVLVIILVMVLLVPHSSGVIIYVFHDVPCTLLQFIHWVVVIWAIVLFWIAVIIYYIAIIPSVFLQVKPHHNCSWAKHCIHSILMCKAVQPEQCILYLFSLYCVNHDMYNVVLELEKNKPIFKGINTWLVLSALWK